MTDRTEAGVVETAAREPGFRPPLSVTHAELLDADGDRAFRRLIRGLVVVAGRLQRVPEAFGQFLGISGAQYSALISIAHLQGEAGIGIRRLADRMHLPTPHVTTTVGRLAAAGLVLKRPNPADGRGVLVTLSPQGEAALRRLAPFQQQVNDTLFGHLDRDEFAALARLIDGFVHSTGVALATVEQLQRHDAGGAAHHGRPTPARREGEKRC